MQRNEAAINSQISRVTNELSDELDLLKDSFSSYGNDKVIRELASELSRQIGDFTDHSEFKPGSAIVANLDKLFDKVSDAMKSKMNNLNDMPSSVDKQESISDYAKMIANLKNIRNRLTDIKNLLSINLEGMQSVTAFRNTNIALNNSLEKLGSTVDMMNKVVAPQASESDLRALKNVKNVKPAVRADEEKRREIHGSIQADIQELTKNVTGLLASVKSYRASYAEGGPPSIDDFDIEEFQESRNYDQRGIKDINTKIGSALEKYDEIENTLLKYAREGITPTTPDNVKAEREKTVLAFHQSNLANLENIRQLATNYKLLNDEFANATLPWNQERRRLELCERGIARKAQEVMQGVQQVRADIKAYEREPAGSRASLHTNIIDNMVRSSNTLETLRQQSMMVSADITSYPERMKNIKGVDKKLVASHAKVLADAHKQVDSMLDNPSKEHAQLADAFAVAQRRANLGKSIAHHGVFRSKPVNIPIPKEEASEERSDLSQPTSSPDRSSPKGRKSS